MRIIPMLFPVLPYSQLARNVYNGVIDIKILNAARDPEVQITKLGANNDIIVYHPVGMEIDHMLGARPDMLVHIWESSDTADDAVKAEVLRIEKIRDNPQFRNCVISAGYELTSAINRIKGPRKGAVVSPFQLKHRIALPPADSFNYNPIGQGSSTIPQPPTSPSSGQPHTELHAAPSSSSSAPVVSTGQGMRPTCLKCARKHISQAIVLLTESQLGYPDHRWLAIGHLAEASEEVLKSYPRLAERLRADRLVLMDTDRMPDLLTYFTTIRVIETNGYE